MRKAPAIPLFGDAYMADTRHLGLEEHGAYLLLLMVAWRSPDCALPDDDKRLAMMLSITPKKWARLKPQVMAFWDLSDAGWQQKRLLKERRFVAKKSEENRDAANARWQANSLKNNGTDDANGMPNGMPNACENDAPSPTPLEEEERKKEEVTPPDGGSQYAFGGRIIRLTVPDLERWESAYPDLDLRALLQSRDDWLATEADEKTRRRWFVATSNYLANRQQEIETQRREAKRYEDRITV